jgi:hypothetical protein
VVVLDLSERVCERCGVVVGDPAVHERREQELELLRAEIAALIARQ